MLSNYVLAGLVVGVFVFGIAIGSLLINHQTPVSNTRDIRQFPNGWMNSMMSNPSMMGNWTQTMMQNPQFMNKMMTQMMSNPDFRQQYMGTWMMSKYKNQINDSLSSFPSKNMTLYQHMIIKSDKVSIVKGAWQINTTESYHPTIIQINTGTKVNWINDDTIVHTVTDVNGTFDSDLIQPGSGWEFTFYNEGKYNYYCAIHPWMKGMVIVT